MVYVPGSLTQGKKTKTYVPGSLTQNKTAATYQPGTLTTGGIVKNKDLTSSTGLYNLAVQNGLQGQADKIIARQTGEKTKQIFSGGFISDTFDVINALQYGVVGLLKGKSFVEGVRNRDRDRKSTR